MVQLPDISELLSDAAEALNIPEIEHSIFAWNCDECGTVMDDIDGQTQPKCTNCGYTWEQKCDRWP